MNIKILGTGCSSCMTLENRVRRLVDSHKIDTEVILIKDIMEIIKYGVMSTPALVIDEKVVAKGRVPKDAEILGWIEG